MVDFHGEIDTPDEARRKEYQDQDDSVVQLDPRASHIDFVEEPVEVEERIR